MHKSVERCHYTYTTQFEPHVQEVIMTMVIMIMAMMIMVMMIMVMMIMMMVTNCRVIVEFHSDYSVTSTGFKIDWVAV